MNKAKVIVSTKQGLDYKVKDLIKGYHLEYTDESDLREKYEEARKAWSEYYVSAVDGNIVLDNPKTYMDEQLEQLFIDMQESED